MSNYVQTTFFTPKDTLPTTNPAKTIFGAAYDVEFGNIASAITSKYDNTTAAPSLLSLTVGTPTGGNLGAGSINAQSIFVNNVAVALTGSGVTSVTGTANQITASPTTGAVILTLPQNVIIPTPAAGVALTVNTASAGVVINSDSGTVTTLTNYQIRASGTTGGIWGIGMTAAVAFAISRIDVALTPLSISLSGSVVIAAPSSGVTLTATAVAGGQAAAFTAPSGSSGVIINAGGTASDAALRVLNGAATANLFEIFGDGHGFIASATWNGITWSTAGNVTVNAPTSGVNLATFLAGTGDIVTARNSGSSFQLALGTTASFAYIDASNASSGLALTTQGSANTRLSISNSGNVTIAAPSAGSNLTLTAIAATGTTAINSTGSTSGFNIYQITNTSGTMLVGVEGSSGGALFTSTSAFSTVLGSQSATALALATGSIARLIISAAGGLFTVGATGGDQGLGTVNAGGLFINGVAVTTGGTATTGSFTGTITGVTAATPTCKWTKIGNSVTLRIAAWSSTGTAASMTMTGIPAAIQPATAGVLTTASSVEDNTVIGKPMIASVSGGTMTFSCSNGTTYATTNFTGSGTRLMNETTLVWDTN